ncbi:hypothetical protein MUG94_05005 [Arthrobacter gengyunqii]|uniref:Cell wall protein n=1 Tax=Arthrobacter gengyunqii TaxID=2886940 RepID=A0A9X1S745_9MICC|nr:hypothetical protein [Arthrobacter gengyunqii]MCC3269667.1 hypothetical protein [Arthrobacter gengyunqii]UOY97126.1 hypothetical protein MUG94_05005 [Arthrobacter gengyunqii]
MTRFTTPKAGWSRRLIAASAVGAVAAAGSLAGAPAAFAAKDYLEFSLDGTTYASSIPGPLFNEALQYIPGASSGTTIWVRNSSGEPARLSSAAFMSRSDPELSRLLGLTAGLKSELPSRTTLGAEGSCTDLSQAWDLDGGEEVELSLVVDLSTNAPNDTMNRSADFDMVFLLESEDAAPRTACAALAGSSQPPAGSESAPGNPAPTGTVASASELATLSGTGIPRLAAESNSIFPATLPERPADAGPSQAMGPAEQTPQAGIIPAGFQSTVEPIIRSLSGTLLIGMSVLFTAAVVLRLRNRSANE